MKKKANATVYLIIMTFLAISDFIYHNLKMISYSSEKKKCNCKI